MNGIAFTPNNYSSDLITPRDSNQKSTLSKIINIVAKVAYAILLCIVACSVVGIPFAILKAKDLIIGHKHEVLVEDDDDLIYNIHNELRVSQEETLVDMDSNSQEPPSDTEDSDTEYSDEFPIIKTSVSQKDLYLDGSYLKHKPNFVFGYEANEGSVGNNDTPAYTYYPFQNEEPAYQPNPNRPL